MQDMQTLQVFLKSLADERGSIQLLPQGIAPIPAEPVRARATSDRGWDGDHRSWLPENAIQPAFASSSPKLPKQCVTAHTKHPTCVLPSKGLNAFTWPPATISVTKLLYVKAK
jgi:hypothetical protein